MASSFGQDLVSASFSFFRFAEVVTERLYSQLDPLYDRRIARLAVESRSMQMALRCLKRHLSKEHQESLDSLDVLTTYLHGSFEAALNYKKPYSNANVHGLPIEASAVENNDVASNEMTLATVFCGRLAAMGMLVVHYMTLEFTVMLARIEDAKKPDNELMTTEEDFYSIMQGVYTHLNNRETELAALFDGIDGTDAGPSLAHLQQLVTTIIDVNIFTDAKLEHVQKEFHNHTPKEALFIRQIYYSVMIASLATYVNPDIPKLYKDVESKIRAFREVGLGNNPWRPLEDRNYRSVLSKKFKGYTQNPVYEYATQPYAPPDGGKDMVIQRSGGLVNVTPRVQVHIYRKPYAWDAASDWRSLATTVGEFGVMWDLLYALPALVATNHQFRTSAAYPSAELHSLHTRFMGPMDLFKIRVKTPNGPAKTFVDLVDGYKKNRAEIQDPIAPHATSTQPMPDDLVAWTLKMQDKFRDKLNSAVTNGVIARGQTETPKAVPLDHWNVTWIRDIYPPDYPTMQSYEYKNSMFLLHFGSALLHIDQHICCSPMSVLGASDNKPMELANTEYARYHDIPDAARSPFTVYYDSIKAMRASIRETQDAFIAAYQKRKPAFLHPASWLSKDTLKDWQKVQNTDQVQGTILQFPALRGDPVDPADGSQDKLLDAAVTLFAGV